MTSIGWDYMGADPQLFRRSMAEALAALLCQRYRTAKQLARGVGIDVKTAENLRQGHLSVTTLQKVMAAEGRALWDRLGDELFGETFYQFEERRLAAVIREAESVRSNLVRLRAQSEELLSSAPSLDETGGRRVADAHGRAPRGSRAADDRGGHGGPDGARDRRTASVEPRSFGGGGR